MTTNTKFKINTVAILAALNKIGKITIIIVAMAVGFISGEIYRNYQTHITAMSMQECKTPEQTSVAINERGELMIINRKKGSYSLYDSQIGNMIFGLYANKIYQSKITK
jgi:isoleucyl-tRNA synthetase